MNFSDDIKTLIHDFLIHKFLEYDPDHAIGHWEEEYEDITRIDEESSKWTGPRSGSTGTLVYKALRIRDYHVVAVKQMEFDFKTDYGTPGVPRRASSILCKHGTEAIFTFQMACQESVLQSSREFKHPNIVECYDSWIELRVSSAELDISERAEDKDDLTLTGDQLDLTLTENKLDSELTGNELHSKADQKDLIEPEMDSKLATNDAELCMQLEGQIALESTEIQNPHSAKTKRLAFKADYKNAFADCKQEKLSEVTQPYKVQLAMDGNWTRQRKVVIAKLRALFENEPTEDDRRNLAKAKGKVC